VAVVAAAVVAVAAAGVAACRHLSPML
jgi:hypothetical protein